MTKTVLSILDAIANLPGKNDKVAILEAHKLNKDLETAFYLAYNGLLSFYIKKLPVAITHTGNYTLTTALALIPIVLAGRQKTGNDAIAWVKHLLEECSADDAEVVRRVLGRDLRIGASEGSADKVWPGLIPSFNVMLATAYSDKALAKINFPAIAQLKADGSRTQCIVDLAKRIVSFWTRSGKEVLLSAKKANEILDIFPTEFKGSWVLDGEIVYRLQVDENPLAAALDEPESVNEGLADRSTGNGIYNKAVKGTISESEENGLHFVLWDLIPYDEWQKGKSTAGYNIRLEMLNMLSHTDFTSVIETHVVNNLAEATAIYSKYIALDLEGIILKNVDSVWENKRSKNQVKFKQVMSADLRITGVKPGKAGKKYAEIAGTLTCQTECKLLEVDASGMSDAERLWFWENQQEVVTNGTIVEIEYNGIVKRRGSNVSSLFLPQFVRIREDKTTANTLDELQDQKANVSL